MLDKTNKNEEKETYSMQEVADLLGIAVKTAYDGAQRGDFPAFKVMGRWIVPKAAIQKLMNGGLELSGRNE